MPTVRNVCVETRVDHVVVSDEDFETADLASLVAAGWEDATLAVDEDPADITQWLSQFVGRFGKNLPAPTKIITLPLGTDSVRVTFKFYQIDDWDGGKFQVKVNDDELVDFGFFPNPNLNLLNDQIEGVSGAIQWTVTTEGTPIHTLGFGTWIDQEYTVVLDLPLSQLSSNTLTLQFIASLSAGIGNESAGIDDLKIISCPA
jgi:hypothetical protein